MKHLKKNSEKIDGAFSRFRAAKDEVIRRGMYKLLEEAVQYALMMHDERHQKHVEMGDTYGWMLVHNGAIEEVAVVAAPGEQGDAADGLKSKASELPKNGWAGIVMAGMRPSSYFAVSYEEDILSTTAGYLKWNGFNKYFRQL